jgi:hypothetical protein
VSLNQTSRNGAPTSQSNSISGEKQGHGKGQKSLRQFHCWVVTGCVFECEFVSFELAFIYLKILNFLRIRYRFKRPFSVPGRRWASHPPKVSAQPSASFHIYHFVLALLFDANSHDEYHPKVRIALGCSLLV